MNLMGSDYRTVAYFILPLLAALISSLPATQLLALAFLPFGVWIGYQMPLRIDAGIKSNPVYLITLSAALTSFTWLFMSYQLCCGGLTISPIVSSWLGNFAIAALLNLLAVQFGRAINYFFQDQR